MKNILKIFVAILFIGLTVFLTSCGEYGGTIIVTNNYSEDVEVAVYTKFVSHVFVFSYEDKYGPKNIAAGGTGSFNVKSNTEYTVFWRYGRYDSYKTIDVANGETVRVDIP